MKVLQLVPYASVDGAFGGPVAVAFSQSEQLSRDGVDVTVAFGWDGRLETSALARAGVKVWAHRAVKLCPRAGVVGRLSVTLLLRVLIRARHFDVVHMHYGRDLISQTVGTVVRFVSRRYVVQPHGMLPVRSSRVSRVLDALSTRPTLREASKVLSLTEIEDEQLLALAGNAIRLDRLTNGVASSPALPLAMRSNQVLFCSRLHVRKRPQVFVEMAHRLLDEGSSARFALIGPDEGEAGAVKSKLASRWHRCGRVNYLGPMPRERVLEEMRAARVLVLPSVEEPFPMVVLESLASGTPVVITESCGVAAQVAESGSGYVTDGSVENLSAATAKLLNDDDVWEKASKSALEATEVHYSIGAVAARLLGFYESSDLSGRPTDA